MAAPKHVIVMSLLDKLIQNEVFSAKDIERALGRRQCVPWPRAWCNRSGLGRWRWPRLGNPLRLSGSWPYFLGAFSKSLTNNCHPFSLSPHGGGAVMPVPPRMEIRLWEGGLVTLNHQTRHRSGGSISRSPRNSFLGPSRKATPKRGLQPLNSSVLWFFADFSWPNRSRDPPVSDFPLEVTTKAMSSPSLVLHPRNRTPQLFWWNSFGSCIWRDALWPLATFLANSTDGRMSSHTSTMVASLTSSASMWERLCLTSFCFPN